MRSNSIRINSGMKTLITGLLLFSSVLSANETLALLKTPGHVAIARHALAPGTGDPAAFDLEDCSSQRNLSEEGRRQARNMGNLFREAGIREASVFTSQWCRCRDTATLMDLGKVAELPALNSFFRRPERKRAQISDLRKWLQKAPDGKPVILITHQVVITALTDVFPASGEILILRAGENGDWEVAGRVKTM